MRVLVTGGAGMIGSHAAEHFARKGAKVTVLDNLMRSELMGSHRKSVEFNWNYLAGVANVRRVKGDVRNAADVRRAIGPGVDAVIHAAGQPGVGLSLRKPWEDFTINALWTLNVLEAIKRHSPKAAVVYCSTNKVYGENVEKLKLAERKTRYVFSAGRGVPETMSIDSTGHTPYGASKFTGDLYMQEYAHAYGLKTGVFRMSCIYGTRQFGFEDQGWVAWFSIAAVRGLPLTIYGDGKQVRDVLFVGDLIDAYERFIRGPIKHGVWNMGGGPGNTASLRELIGKLEKIVGRKLKVRYAPWRTSDQRVYISDISKARRELKWRPTVTFDQGLGSLIDWVRSNPGLF